MTTFQAIIYSIIDGVSEFLPIGAKAHHILVPYLIGWQPPSDAFMGCLALGSSLALLIYFRHDWASMISCFLQVIIYRKRPMTLDERLPLFLGITLLPSTLVRYYSQDLTSLGDWSPLTVAAIFAGVGIPLWFFDNFSRKTKAMYDWKWSDAAIIGVFQATAVVPGWEPLSSAILAASLLNYKREPALKYAYFCAFPVLIARAISYMKGVQFHSPAPLPDVSWLSFSVAILVTLLVGLLSIGGFMKHVQQRGIGQYVVYRWILALGVCALYWVRNR